MATFNLTAFNFSGAAGYVSGLQYNWNTTNYTEAYLTITKNGSSVAYVFPINPPSTGTNDYTQSMSASFESIPTAGAFVITAYVKPTGSGLVAVGSETRYIYAVSATAGAGISSTSGSGDYIGGSAATIGATVNTNDPDYDRVWAGWWEGSTFRTSNNPWAVTVAGNATLEARASAKLKTPTVSSQSVTQSTIAVTLNSVTGATTYYARISGGNWQSGSYSGPFNFTGLTQSTSYLIEYKVTGSSALDSDIGGNYISTASNARPANWSWSASNGSASAAQTQAAYNAVTKVPGYDLSDFSYLVWNDLVDKVDAFAVYKSTTAVGAGAKMSTGDKALSATRFNLLLTAVNAMASTGITSRSAGQLVYGAYFTTITSTLNNIT